MVNFPLLLEPEQLEKHLDDAGLLIVDVRNGDSYARGHIRGAINLAYADLIRATPPAMGLLPDIAQLSKVMAAIGLTPDRHVVAYDDEGNGRASRLLSSVAPRNVNILASFKAPVSETGNQLDLQPVVVGRLRRVRDLDDVARLVGDGDEAVFERGAEKEGHVVGDETVG